MDPFSGMAIYARVCEAGGISRAAAELGLTKSSVSEAVRRLEARLGVRLLDRTTRRLAPTEAGQAFYARARVALEAARAAEVEARALHVEPRGRLRVAAPDGLGRVHVVPVLHELLEVYPDLQLELVEAVAAVDLVEAGIDVAIRISPAPAENLVVRRLGTSRVAIVGAPAYFAVRPPPARPEDLPTHRIIGFSPLYWGREWRFEDDRGPVAVPVAPALSTNQVETMRAAALAGIGLAAIPSWMVAEDLAAGALVQVLRAWRTPESGLYAVYPSNRLMAAKVKLFVDRFARRLREGGG